MLYTAKDQTKWRICYDDLLIRGGYKRRVYFVVPKGHRLHKGKYAKKLPEDLEIIEVNQRPVIKRKIRIIEE